MNAIAHAILLVVRVVAKLRCIGISFLVDMLKWLRGMIYFSQTSLDQCWLLFAIAGVNNISNDVPYNRRVYFGVHIQ
jgi:hypothetical protein